MATIKVPQEVGVTAICDGIKQVRKTAELAGSAVIELATETDNGFAEVETVLNDKSDKGAAVSVTVSTSWSSGSSGSGDYSYYYDISIDGLTANDLANVSVSPASMDTAVDCGLCSVCETRANVLRLYAKSKPTTSIDIEYWITKGKE